MTAYADALVEIKFTTENIGYAAGKNATGGTLLKTEDGGATWTEIYNSNVVGDYLWKIQILESNPNVIFGAVESTNSLGEFIKSTDGGNTWFSNAAQEAHLQAVGFISETHGWIGGHTTGFYETTDGGATWTNLNVGNNLNRIFVVSPNTVFGAGTSIYKYTDQSLSTGDITSQHLKSPLQVTLLKNPVNDDLKFTVNFEADDNLLIELYDSNGRFIKQLSRERIKTTGTLKRYSFSVKDLASGVYFLDFHNNSGRQAVKFIKQ